MPTSFQVTWVSSNGQRTYLASKFSIPSPQDKGLITKPWKFKRKEKSFQMFSLLSAVVVNKTKSNLETGWVYFTYFYH